MNSINENGCSVCQSKIRISHKFVIPYGDRYWDAVIENRDVKFYVRIIENVSLNGRKYYIGELLNGDIAKKYANACIVFGYSNYYGTYRYIIEAMLRVIEGDYSEIKGAGFCTAKPENQH